MTTHLHLVPQLRAVELYLHSPMCLHCLLLIYLSTSTALEVPVSLNCDILSPADSLACSADFFLSCGICLSLLCYCTQRSQHVIFSI
jgi:hypothetical protein